MELNDSGLTNYGWIGVRITNEANATGEVVGWGYETLAGVPILAGTAVPEPSTITSVLLGGAAIAGFVWRRLRRR